jgi:hypothetical protein
LVLRTGFRRRKPVIHFLPSGSLLCLAAKIRPAKTRICIYVRLSPKLSWTKPSPLNVAPRSGKASEVMQLLLNAKRGL